MRMLDLFCGRWGWSRAFAARGWECVGVDWVEPPDIPAGCCFVKMNVLDLDDSLEIGRLAYSEGWRYDVSNFDFVCASSPCDEYSMFQMRNFHANPPYPATGVRLFNHTRELCEESGVPYIMENVRAAQQFVGRAVAHCGPFYLWGNAVPPILPQGINKGFGKMDREFILKIGSSKSKKRMEHKAKVATIPNELANCVADYAERLIEQKLAG
jgi:hypothetical protein